MAWIWSGSNGVWTVFIMPASPWKSAGWPLGLIRIYNQLLCRDQSMLICLLVLIVQVVNKIQRWSIFLFYSFNGIKGDLVGYGENNIKMNKENKTIDLRLFNLSKWLI